MTVDKVLLYLIGILGAFLLLALLAMALLK
jgi:hypothetical protein